MYKWKYLCCHFWLILTLKVRWVMVNIHSAERLCFSSFPLQWLWPSMGSAAAWRDPAVGVTTSWLCFCFVSVTFTSPCFLGGLEGQLWGLFHLASLSQLWPALFYFEVVGPHTRSVSMSNPDMCCWPVGESWMKTLTHHISSPGDET